MAPSPQCKALAAAMNNKGVTYAQIASQIGQSEQHVVDICTGAANPTQAEYDALAVALGIQSSGASYSHAKK